MTFEFVTFVMIAFFRSDNYTEMFYMFFYQNTV